MVKSECVTNIMIKFFIYELYHENNEYRIIQGLVLSTVCTGLMFSLTCVGSTKVFESVINTKNHDILTARSVFPKLGVETPNGFNSDKFRKLNLFSEGNFKLSPVTTRTCML